MRDSTAKNVKFHADLHRRVTAGILHAGRPSGAQFARRILSHLQPSSTWEVLIVASSIPIHTDGIRGNPRRRRLGAVAVLVAFLAAVGVASAEFGGVNPFGSE